MTPLPCVWARVTCYGQVDADGLGWAGCGSYDLAAPDRLTLKENVKTCKLCGSSNIDVFPETCTGATTKPMLVPTTPILSEPGEPVPTKQRGTPRGTMNRRPKTNLHGLESFKHGAREANGRIQRKRTTDRHFVTDYRR